MRKRSSILFYFDNFHLISSLSDEQLGLLFRAVMEFSEQEVNGGGADLLAFPSRYPRMQDQAVGCFLFMADNVRRDAAAYNEKCANYRAAAQRRQENAQSAAPPSRKPAAPPARSFSTGAPTRSTPTVAPPEVMPAYVREFQERMRRRAQKAASAESHDFDGPCDPAAATEL